MTSAPLDQDTIDKRLTDLEIKASFGEDLVEQLNQVVVRQQQEIDWLLGAVRQLRTQLPDSGATQLASPGHDLPPHY